MDNIELKQKIKDYYVEISEDKFTKVKFVKCKHKFKWEGDSLENKFMLTEARNVRNLHMEIDYRHKDNEDSIFFKFTYASSEGYPGMTNIVMYLILDDDKTIKIDEASGFFHTSQSKAYLETAQIAVNMADFISIANAKKIDYSIRFGQGALDDCFSKKELSILKGFYNAAFDDDFEIENLASEISEFEKKERDEEAMRIWEQEYQIREQENQIRIQELKDSGNIVYLKNITDSDLESKNYF